MQVGESLARAAGVHPSPGQMVRNAHGEPERRRLLDGNTSLGSVRERSGSRASMKFGLGMLKCLESEGGLEFVLGLGFPGGRCQVSNPAFCPAIVEFGNLTQPPLADIWEKEVAHDL